MVYIAALDVTDETLDKIERKHAVQWDEVEEACFQAPPALQPRRGRDGTILIFSRTNAGRYLLIVLAGRGAGEWLVVTAREMTRTERRLYERQGG